MIQSTKDFPVAIPFYVGQVSSLRSNYHIIEKGSLVAIPFYVGQVSSIVSWNYEILMKELESQSLFM